MINLTSVFCLRRTRSDQEQVRRDNRNYIVAASIQPYDKLNFSFLFSCPAASPIPQCQRCVCDSDDRNEQKQTLNYTVELNIEIGGMGAGRKTEQQQKLKLSISDG